MQDFQLNRTKLRFFFTLLALIPGTGHCIYKPMASAHVHRSTYLLDASNLLPFVMKLQRCGRCLKWIHLFFFYFFFVVVVDFIALTVKIGEWRIARSHRNGESFEVLFLWICAFCVNFWPFLHGRSQWNKIRICCNFQHLDTSSKVDCFDPNFWEKFVDNG